MARYRLLAGKHAEKGKVYRRGQAFDSDSDLLKLNHPSSFKFELLGDAEGTRSQVLTSPPEIPSFFPGGQVSSGKQSATGTPEGTISGPEAPEEEDDKATQQRQAARERTLTGRPADLAKTEDPTKQTEPPASARPPVSEPPKSQQQPKGGGK